MLQINRVFLLSFVILDNLLQLTLRIFFLLFNCFLTCLVNSKRCWIFFLSDSAYYEIW